MDNFNFYPWLGALALLVFSNNIVGMLEAVVTKTFDKTKAGLGAAKAGGVALSLVSFFYAGSLIPNVQFEFEGLNLTLEGMLALLMFGVIGFYAVKAVKKIASLMGTEVPTKNDLIGGNPVLGK